MVEKKTIIQTKEKGAFGSFKVSAAEKAEKKPKKADAKKPAKVKKPAGEKKAKSPKKKAAALFGQGRGIRPKQEAKNLEK